MRFGYDLFVVLMVILILCQAVVCGLFLTKDSSIHTKIKEQLTDKIKEDYEENGDDGFIFAINILNYLLECCGMSGPGDFKAGVPVRSCCRRSVIELDISKCSQPAPTANFYTQGCYDKLQDEILSNKTTAAIVLTILLVLQALEVLFAVLVIKDAKSFFID